MKLWLTALSFLLVVAPPAVAVSLFDVVQLAKAGYSDSQIIDIVRKTESRFYIDADTIITLKKEGVSEKLLRALLEVRSDEPPPIDAADRDRNDESWRNGTTRSPAPGDERLASPPAAHERHVAMEATDQTPADPVPERTAADHALFTVVEFDEGSTASSHADHLHHALAIEGVPLLVLRSESGHATVALRAGEIAESLNAVGAVPGRFRAVTSPTAAVVYETEGNVRQVLAVTRGDVVAYQRRSLGSVTPGRLAGWWAALLNDFTSVLVRGEAAHQLPSLRAGAPLDSIQKALGQESERATPRSRSITRALDSLSAEERERLVALVTSVPAEFQEDLP